MVDDQVQLSVALSDANGNALSGRAVQYESTHPDRFTVSPTGLVTMVRPWSGFLGEVRATSEGVTAKVPVDWINGWAINQTPDPLGGFPTVWMALRADPNGANGSTNGAAANFAVACYGGATKRLAVYLQTGGPITANGSIRYRFDDETATAVTWIESPENDFEVLFVPSAQVLAFAERVATAQSLQIEYREYSGPARFPRFTLRRTGEAWATVRAACS